MCLTYLLAHYSHHVLKYVDFTWEQNCQHKLLGFVDERVIQMFLIFYYIYVYNFSFLITFI